MEQEMFIIHRIVDLMNYQLKEEDIYVSQKLRTSYENVPISSIKVC